MSNARSETNYSAIHQARNHGMSNEEPYGNVNFFNREYLRKILSELSNKNEEAT